MWGACVCVCVEEQGVDAVIKCSSARTVKVDIYEIIQ